MKWKNKTARLPTLPIILNDNDNDSDAHDAEKKENRVEKKWRQRTSGKYAPPYRLDWSEEHSLDQHLRQDPRGGREYLEFRMDRRC